MRLVLQLSAVVFALSLTMCNSDPAGIGGTDAGAASTPPVGAKGGTVTEGGVKLTIPEGALDRDVAITIATSTTATPPAGYVAHSPIYVFGPDGLVFKKPVKIELPLAPGVRDTDQIIWSSKVAGVEKLPSRMAGQVMTAEVTHFSEGWIGAGGGSATCPAGTYDQDRDPSTPCLSWRTCAAGSFVTNSPNDFTDRACAACPTGTFSTTENAATCAAWTNCPAGTHVSVPPSDHVDRECLPCPAGTMTTSANQDACTPVGACPPGTERLADGACLACGAGFYCPGAATPKTPCSGETWDHDSNPSTACVSWTTCLAGQRVWNAGSTTTDRTCIACASGTFTASQNAATCTDWQTCSVGNYVSTPGTNLSDRVCAVCAPNTTTSVPNQNVCTANGACPAGTEQTAPGVCAPCPSGTYCAGSTTAKQACGLGTWDDDGDSATACIPWTECVPGQYTAGNGTATTDQTCVFCGAGSFSIGTNANACVAWATCDIGQYESTPGSITSNRQCSLCAAGTTTTSPNQSSCVAVGACAAGTKETAPGVCTPCAVGTYCPGGTAPETACAGETWDDDKTPATACVAWTTCAAGQYEFAKGSSTSNRQCLACAIGTFSATSNATACTTWTTCLEGTYVSSNPSSVEDRTCLTCPPNTFTTRQNQDACLPLDACPPGTVQTTAGTASSPPVCSPCAPGTYCPGGTVPKTDCTFGTFDHDGDPGTACVAWRTCAMGTSSTPGTSTTDRTCTPCDAGTFNTTTNAAGCFAWKDCVAGQYQLAPGSSTNDRTCAGCANSTFTATSNQTTCAAWSTCDAGTYVSILPTPSSDRTCSACAFGTYSATANQSSCNPWGSCNAGSEQIAAPTSTSPPICAGCEPGTYCPGGATPKADCALGFWDHDTSSATACVAWQMCPAGTSAVDGTKTTDRTCTTCGAGMFASGTNAGACTAWKTCPAGQFISTPGTASTDRICSDCAAGTYTSTANQTTCANGLCPAGQYQTAPGTTTTPASCAACSIGDYCAGGTSPRQTCASGTWDHDGNPATACQPWTDCPPGTFVDAPAPGPSTNRTCTACAAGTTSTGFNAASCQPLPPNVVSVCNGAAGIGGGHTCAALSDGSVRCWGYASYGVMGYDDPTGTALQRLPIAIAGISGAVEVTCGAMLACARDASGGVKCWGQNSGYQGESDLGDGSSVQQSSTPVTVQTAPGVPLTGAVQLTSASFTSSQHTCARLSNGGVKCWGSNGYGQLGDTTYSTRSFPVDVSGIATATNLFANFDQACASLADGSVLCWGYYGSALHATPTLLNTFTPPVKYTWDADEKCVLKSDASLWCYRDADVGNPLVLSGVLQVVSGYLHHCALMTDHTVQCWGNNDDGQLGDGTTTSRAATALPVPGLVNVVQLTSGPVATCALLSDGNVMCWGWNPRGALGTASTTTPLKSPAAVVWQ